jgi:hypothetical protein
LGMRGEGGGLGLKGGGVTWCPPGTGSSAPWLQVPADLATPTNRMESSIAFQWYGWHVQQRGA